MDSLFDQSALIALAERLVKAARSAGADAADAVAMRSVSQSVEVRDSAVEESERAESNDMGLRVLVGKRQAVVSTNDIKGESVTTLAERAVAMARAAPEDRFAGLADPSAARAAISGPRSGGPELAGGRGARGRGAPRRRGRPRGQRRQQVGRRLGLGRHRRHGAVDQPRLLRRLSRLAPQYFHAGDRRRGHRHGDRLRLFLDAACCRSRPARNDRPHRRRAGGRPAQPAQGLDPQGAGGFRRPRRGLAGRPSGRRDQW